MVTSIYCEQCKKITTHIVVNVSILTKWRTLTITDSRCCDCGKTKHFTKEILRTVEEVRKDLGR